MRKTVWITGGSRGIGAAAVRAFVQDGWKVAFCYRSRTEQAEALAIETGALAIQADVTKREDVQKCMNRIHEVLGPVGAVVCNAGVAQQKMFCDLTDDDWDYVMNGNLRSVFYTIQAALPDLVHDKDGAIVTVSSVWGVAGASCESHYAASKARTHRSDQVAGTRAWSVGHSSQLRRTRCHRYRDERHARCGHTARTGGGN